MDFIFFLRQMKHSSVAAIALILLAAAVIAPLPAQAQTESLLYQFGGSPDGANPYAGPIVRGSALYGTTMQGGTGPGETGYGAVWTLNLTTGKETVLHTFQGLQQESFDGAEPMGGVIADSKGNLYGTTFTGGKYNYGTVYVITKIGKNYSESVLYSFSGGLDGGYPDYVTPTLDKSGNIYGTTQSGGYYGNGVVFKLSSSGLTVLHNFSSTLGDGYNPVSGVALDASGNIYGTTPVGGTYGYGTLYEISAAGGYSVLYNFTGGTDGGTPRSPVVFRSGSLYGTTQSGGAGCTWGCGVVFKFTPAKGKKAATETILHTFNGTDGLYPMYGMLVFDSSGNLYGTTTNGGPTNLGNVYRLAPDGTLTTLFNFDQQPDGYAPLGGVARDTKGNLYTTAAFGGNNPGQYGCGTVIKIIP